MPEKGMLYYLSLNAINDAFDVKFPRGKRMAKYHKKRSNVGNWTDKFKGSFHPSGIPYVIIARSSTNNPLMSTHDLISNLITVAYKITSIFLHSNTVLFLFDFSSVIPLSEKARSFITLVILENAAVLIKQKIEKTVL